MKVNIDKTKIIVSRRGGIVKQNEKWLLNDKPVEVVSHYKYLGMTFTYFHILILFTYTKESSCPGRKNNCVT